MSIQETKKDMVITIPELDRSELQYINEDTDVDMQTLTIEVTRRCNQQCPHCLRGDAQDIDIDLETIDYLLQNVSSIQSLTFTGGEPSLNIPAIRYTLEKCVEYGIPVYSFFIATNGMANVDELIEVSNDWFLYCFESSQAFPSEEFASPTWIRDINFFREESACGLALSIDNFHEGISKETYLKFCSLPYYTDTKTHLEGYKILNQGRASDIYASDYDCETRNPVSHNDDPTIDYDESENRIEVMELSLCANGDVFTSCDYEYFDDEVFNIFQKHILLCLDEYID